MGKKKDKPKAHEYYLGTGKFGKLKDRYGVEGVHYGHPDGRSGKPNRSQEDVDNDIAAKMMGDYHTQESIHNAAHAGHKGAKKIAKKGITGKNIYDAWDVYKDIKKEYVGGGGMNGAKNISGLTYATGKARDGAKAKAKTEPSNDVPTLDYYDGPEDKNDHGLEYYSPGEQAKSRQEAYERRIAPEYFRDSFRERLQTAMNSVKVK